MKAINYVLLEDVLYKKYKIGTLLKFLRPKKALLVTFEVHKGHYRAHQFGIKIRWLIMNRDFCWPNITTNCISYAKGFKECLCCQLDIVRTKFAMRRHLSVIKRRTSFINI
jgi:hypothetical protein